MWVCSDPFRADWAAVVSVSVDTLQVVGKHPGLVCVTTALVGAQDTGLLHLPRGGKGGSCWHTV